MFLKFGILSFTENFTDNLMWGYYSQNLGFVLKFETSLLPKKLFGPFPINYVDVFDRIDISQQGPDISFLYQTNIKHKSWERENEWRYLFYNPNGRYHPYFAEADFKSRYLQYNPKALCEVILGYDFTNPKRILYNERTQDYDILNFNGKKSKSDKVLKKRFLNGIIRRNLPCRQIVRYNNRFLLDTKETHFEKMSPNKFKVYNKFKQPDL